MSNPAPAGSRAKRNLALACTGIVAGAGLVLLGAHYPWLHEVISRPEPLPSRRVARTGTDLSGLLRALGLLGLAGGVAIPATRRWGRQVLGVVLSIAGAGVLIDLVLVARAHGDVLEVGWTWVTILGGLGYLAAALAVTVRGRRWASMGRRYEAPRVSQAADRRPIDPRQEMWDALDRGEDPTGR